MNVTTQHPETGTQKPPAKKATEREVTRHVTQEPRKKTGARKASSKKQKFELAEKGTVAHTIQTALMRGADTDAVLKAVHKNHRGWKVADEGKYVAFYRCKLKAAGQLKKAS